MRLPLWCLGQAASCVVAAFKEATQPFPESPEHWRECQLFTSCLNASAMDAQQSTCCGSVPWQHYAQAVGMLQYILHMEKHVEAKCCTMRTALQLETSPGCAPRSPAICWTRLPADLLRASPSGWSASAQEVPAPGRRLERDAQTPMAE